MTDKNVWLYYDAYEVVWMPGDGDDRVASRRSHVVRADHSRRTRLPRSFTALLSNRRPLSSVAKPINQQLVNSTKLSPRWGKSHKRVGPEDRPNTHGACRAMGGGARHRQVPAVVWSISGLFLSTPRATPRRRYLR